MLNIIKKLHQKLYKKGFTLLELLVVVLIIGVLAGIALPQYRKSVEKAKLAEALLSFKTIKESVERYVLANGLVNGRPEMSIEDIPLDIELSGGEFEDSFYKTKNYRYSVWIASQYYEIEIYTNSDTNYYILVYNSHRNQNECWDGDSKMGKYICQYLESQGWQYNEGDY